MASVLPYSGTMGPLLKRSCVIGWSTPSILNPFATLMGFITTPTYTLSVPVDAASFLNDKIPEGTTTFSQEDSGLLQFLYAINKTLIEKLYEKLARFRSSFVKVRNELADESIEL